MGARLRLARPSAPCQCAAGRARGPAKILWRDWNQRANCGYRRKKQHQSRHDTGEVPGARRATGPNPTKKREGQAMGVTSAAEKWVDEVARLTEPDRVVWCDGSKAEYDRLVEQMLGDGTLVPLNQRTYPGLLPPPQPPLRRRPHRAPHLHLQPRQGRTPARPTTGWRRPRPRRRLGGLFDGAMHGRTMYVIPYLMGPAGSPLSRVGVEVTDSAVRRRRTCAS